MLSPFPTTTQLKNHNNTVCATISETYSPLGNTSEIRNRSGRLMGRYDHKTNTTTNATGGYVGKGNLLGTFVDLSGKY